MGNGNKPAVSTAQRRVRTQKLTLRMLLVLLLTAAVLPLLIYSVVQSVLATNTAVRRASANLQFSATLVAAYQEQVAHSAQQLLVSVSETLRQSPPVGSSCDGYFQRLAAGLPEYASLALADPTGMVVCSSAANRPEPSVADRLYFQSALKTGTLAIGSYTAGRIGGQPTVQFALAAKEPSGALIGVVIASLNLSAIADRLSKIPVPAGGRVQVTDATGVVLVVNPQRLEMIGRPLVSPVLKAALEANSKGIAEGSDGLGGIRYYAFQPPGDPRTSPFFVSASIDREVILGPVWRVLMQDVLVLLTVALFSGVLLWMVVGRRLLRSMNCIVKGTVRIQEGARDVRIPVQPQLTVELSNIATGFNLMADALDKRGYQLEKELARSRQALATLDLTVNNMKEGLIAVDTGGRVSLFNQAANQLFVMDNVPSVLSGGWSRHHGLYLPGTEQLYPDDKLSLAQALNNKSGSSQHVLLRNVNHPQGRLVSCSFRPILNEIGLYGESVVVGALMVFSDITQLQQMQMEQAKSVLELTETKRRLVDAQLVGRIGSWEVDTTTHQAVWSDAALDLMGLTQTAFHDDFDALVSIVHPDDVEQYNQQRLAAWEHRSDLANEYRIVTPAGEIRWLYQSGRARPNARGELTKRSGVIQDITVRKLAELALVESLEKLTYERAKLVEAQHIGRIANWECDALSGNFHASDEFFTICGLPIEAGTLSWCRLLALIHPDDRPGYEQALSDALRDDVVFDARYRLVTPAGHTRWMHQNGRIERDAQGHLVRSVGVLQDISESTLDKKAIAENLDLLKRTGEMAKIGGWELDLADQRLVYSEQVRRLHELDPGMEYTVEIARSAYPPEARHRFAEAVSAATEHGTPWDLELPLITQKGRSIWVRTQGRVIAANGLIKRLAGTLQDITAQYESRQQLRLLQTCVSRLQDALVITEARPRDAEAIKIVYVSDAFEQQTGYSREEAVGQTMHLLQGPETSRETLAAISAAFKVWRPIRVEIANYKKNGELYWAELDISPVPDERGHFTHWVSVQRNITARKLSEQALRDSEQRYAALFASAPLPMMVLSKGDLRYLTVNEAAISSYGFSLAEFQAMTAPDVRVPSERPALEALMKTELPDHLVLSSRHRRKDGSEFPTEGVIRTIHYAGQPAWFVVTQDVSVRAKAEKDVQDQMLTLQRAADAAQAVTAHQTLDAAMNEVAHQARGVIGAHQALVVLTKNSGWSQDQTIYGLSLSDKYEAYRFHAEPVDVLGMYALLCETNQTRRMTQVELEAHPRWQMFGEQADKHPAMRGWLAVPLRGRDGQNIGLLQLSDKYEGDFTLHDEYVISEMAQLAATALENAHLFDHIRDLNAGLEQKVMERTAALSRQEALFRALADEAPQAIWTINVLSEVTYINRAAQALVGGENAQWFGKQWMTLIHPEDLPELLRTWEIAFAQRASYANIRRFRAVSGLWHTMSCTASPVFNDSGDVEFWVGIDTDITNIKATEAALRLSNQELEAFSYSVSHDLRSPLNTIDGFSRLLSKQMAGSATDKAQHYLSRIQAGVAQMGQLIEDLLALAQVSRMQLRIEKVDLSALSQKILDDCVICAPERVVNVRIEAGLAAFGDARLLRVVLENLLGNAWKFTANRSVAQISVGMTTESDGAPIFFVADDGAGFDMAYADKLFTAFQRLHSVQEFQGSGIGLATVSRVIARHGGRLWADAKVDEGAKFFFTLPNIALPLLGQ